MRLIDADALTEEIRHEIKISESPWTHYGWVQKIVDHTPTIDPVKHGRWIQDGFWHDCSVCGHTKPTKWIYCPHCGAKMDGEQG